MEYKYNISDFWLSDSVDPSVLQQQIGANASLSEPLYIDISDTICIHFETTLTTEQKTTLDTIVQEYVYTEIKDETTSDEYGAIISTVEEEGDFTSIADAFDAGVTTVFVKNGVYYETKDINIPNGGIMHGESLSKTVIVLAGSNSVKCDSGGAVETTGTISIDNKSNQVVGVGTTFTNIADDSFILLGTNYYEIKSIESDTNLTIKYIYSGNDLIDSPLSAQLMYTGVKLSNFLIYGNGITTGLYMKGVRHSAVTSVAIHLCGINLHMENCADNSMVSIVLTFSVGIGALIEKCQTVSFSIFNVFNAGSDGIQIDNCTCIICASCASENNSENGIYIKSSRVVSISDTVLLYNNGDGLKTDIDTTCIMVSGAVFGNNKIHGVEFLGTSNNVSNSIVAYNTQYGVVLGNRTCLDSSGVKYNTNNVHIPSTATRCVVSQNLMMHSDVNILVEGSECSITGNIINDNKYGMKIESNDNIISNNIIKENTTGLYINSNENICTANISKENVTGAEIISGSTDNILTSNNFKNNTSSGFIDNGTNTQTNTNLI